MRICFSFYLLDDFLFCLLISNEKNFHRFHFLFTKHFLSFIRFFYFSDAFTFSHVRLEEEIVSFCDWNTNGAGNSRLGLCLFIACES